MGDTENSATGPDHPDDALQAFREGVNRALVIVLSGFRDPLHLKPVFGIDEKTAVRYADSARKLLGPEPETGPGRSP